MRSVYSDPNTEGILFIDATNVFNSLNRQVALHNISCLCAMIHPILVNTYRTATPLYVGGETMWSQEGTTQGDPLAIAMCAIATVPLIQKIQTNGSTQIWYADDASSGGKLESLKQWWDRLNKSGPYFGYFPNQEKSWLLAKPQFLESAQKLFTDSAINITTDGRTYLGAAIGKNNFQQTFQEAKVTEWTQQITTLTKIAKLSHTQLILYSCVASKGNGLMLHELMNSRRLC